MEFGGATANLSKNLSNCYGVSGRSAYDGVFAAPIKLRAPSFSSRLEDYREVFGSSGASSIPFLDVPELNERKKIGDFRRSELDYSKVFGGFGNLETDIPLEELIVEPKHKKKNSFSIGASSERSKAKGGKQFCREDPTNYSGEIPTLLRSSNDTCRINMSYLMVNQGSDVAQVHVVPAYTCLIEEVNPVKVNRVKKSVPVAQDAYSGIHCNEGINEGGHITKSFTVPSPDNTKKQSSKIEVKVKNRSDSIDLFFDASEISNGSNGTHHVQVPPSETVADNLDNQNDDVVISTATKRQTSIRDRSEGATGADSPSYLDDNVDSNSEAAASVAALRKAIEEAQVRMKLAKESMRRKKEGFPSRVKRKSNIDFKTEKKEEDKISCKTVNLEEINMRQAFGEADAFSKVSSGVGKPTMRIEKVRSLIGAKEMLVAEEAMQGTLKKLKSTLAKHTEEFEQKEADDNAKVLDLEEVENNRKELCIESTCRNGSDKLEECDNKIEVVKEYWKQGNNKEKVHAANEADPCEGILVNTRHTSQEVVDETKVVQKTLHKGPINKGLRVNGEGEVKNKVTPFHEPEDCERNLGEQELVKGDEKLLACYPEDGKKIEEWQRNLRAIQEFREIEKNSDQEQKGTEEKVEVSSEPEECEILQFVEPMDKRECSPHGLDSKSLEREIENLGCLDDRKRGCEAGFLDVNREAEHSCQREGAKNTYSNIYVHEIREEIVDHIHDEEDIYLRIMKNSELDGNERVQDSKVGKNEIEGVTPLMEENEGGTEDNKEPVEVIRVTQTGPDYGDIKAEEVGMATGTSSCCEMDETEKWIKTRVSDTTTVEKDETLEGTVKVYSNDVKVDIMGASDASSKHQEKYDKPESIQETNDFCEKHAVETSAFIRGVPELNETVNPMQSRSETVNFEGDAINFVESDIKTTQNQDQYVEEAENDCFTPMLSKEKTTESAEIREDAKEARVALVEEIDENGSNSSNEEKLFHNEHNIEASQIPTMPRRVSSSFKEKGIETTHSNLEENHQAASAMEGKESNGNPEKVDMEKERLKKIDEAKEREREKEKLAVERAIREVRHRALAEARERVALERAAAEARQKKKSDGREGLGKTTGRANEKNPAEKAAMEAKLKTERAAVERATAEARARALERALSEKAASESRNKSDKSVAEQFFGASRDNGMKQNFHSKSFSYGVRDSTDAFDGADGDSAQRCKARSERHQRIGERVAKALAEKNMRDRLVQKEQEERNRIAGALDADVKRWSSGKTGNLRALLSTLQYILGADSGWQPIPLTDIVMSSAVKKAYRKATLFVHPDKLQQRGASIQQKYICEKVFDLLKEAWNRFNMEER